MKGSVGPREHLFYEPFIYHMKHFGNLSFTLMNDFFSFFFFWPELVLKGKLEGTGFERALTVFFGEPVSFSQNRINKRMALELLCERQVVGLEIEL